MDYRRGAAPGHRLPARRRAGHQRRAACNSVAGSHDGEDARMTIVTDNNTAPPAGRGADASAVEHALAAAVQDSTRIGELLDELSRGRLWVPLPDDGGPVTDGSAVTLPTVTYLGSDFIPAFTSAARLPGAAAGPRRALPPRVVPHVVVPAAELARRLPGRLGIALNPCAAESVQVHPEGVAYLASARIPGPDGRIRVGHPPAEPAALLSGIRSLLSSVPAARAAAIAWLSVDFAGEGLVISVTLDDPADGAAQEAVACAIERAAATAPQDGGFPIDVTFPGEGEPNVVDEWISACASPFYVRA
jgi:SseB protein N-terminal domain/SseB protein C-terminal domain